MMRRSIAAAGLVAAILCWQLAVHWLMASNFPIGKMMLRIYAANAAGPKPQWWAFDVFIPSICVCVTIAWLTKARHMLISILLALLASPLIVAIMPLYAFWGLAAKFPHGSPPTNFDIAYAVRRLMEIEALVLLTVPGMIIGISRWRAQEEASKTKRDARLQTVANE